MEDIIKNLVEQGIRIDVIAAVCGVEKEVVLDFVLNNNYQEKDWIAYK